MNRTGQVLVEHILVFLFLVVPLSAGGFFWGKLQYSRVQCARAAFLKARKQLIQENREIRLRLECGSGVVETIHLSPLQSIKSQGPIPHVTEWDEKASSLWAELSLYSSSSPEPGLD